MIRPNSAMPTIVVIVDAKASAPPRVPLTSTVRVACRPNDLSHFEFDPVELKLEKGGALERLVP